MVIKTANDNRQMSLISIKEVIPPGVVSKIKKFAKYSEEKNFEIGLVEDRRKEIRGRKYYVCGTHPSTSEVKIIFACFDDEAIAMSNCRILAARMNTIYNESKSVLTDAYPIGRSIFDVTI